MSFVHRTFPNLEDQLNKFFGRFQFLFNFATEKFVVIQDWRLGVILRALQVAIIIYVLYDVISGGSYLLQEVPKGVITPSTSVTGTNRKNNLQQQQERYENGSLRYCTDGQEYAYEYDGEVYNDFKCVAMDASAIPVSGESKYLITTYIRLDKVYYVPLPEGSSRCPSRVDSIPGATRFGGRAIFDTCLYNTVDNYFPIAPEDIPLSMLHSYYTSVVDKSGSLPETYIRSPDFDGGELNFKSGEPLSLTLEDLLRITGSDLDAQLDDQPNGIKANEAARDNDTQPYPFARLSGLNLVLNFKYYMRALAPDYTKSSGPRADDVICIVEVEAQNSWTSQGSDVQFQLNEIDDPFFAQPGIERPATAEVRAVQADFARYGVQLSFQVSGNMGVFNFFSLVDALVAGAVLLGVAQVVVTYIALYALGLSSRLYQEFMRETVNWRKEYARFAAQSLVAGAAFNQYDSNNSEMLDRQEIYRFLKAIYDEPLDTKQLACLSDFLMRHGESDVDVSKGRLEDISDVKVSTINMKEWIEIFTEEKVHLDSLTRLIDSEYKNEKVNEILVRLAEGRSLRDLSTVDSATAAALTRSATGDRTDEQLLQPGTSEQD